jgi:hypothetical protein
MAGGGCFLIPVVSKRNEGVTLANHSRRGRVGAGWCLASKRRRQSEASGRNGALPADGGSDLRLVPRRKKGGSWAGWAQKAEWAKFHLQILGRIGVGFQILMG